MNNKEDLSFTNDDFGENQVLKQVNQWKEDAKIIKATFQPAASGQTNRLLYRQPVRENEAAAEYQAIYSHVKSPDKNYNNYSYLRTAEFPQPSIAGIGAVTSGGAKDTNRYFFSQNWAVAKPGTGNYTITHNLGDNKYNVFLTPIATAAFTVNISAFNVNDFQVKTWNAAGVATDCAFTFIVYIIP